MQQTSFLDSLAPTAVLCVAAHPDDVDFGAGGTVAAFAEQGAKVYYLVLTDGGKGSDDRSMSTEALRDQRREEQREAGRQLGVSDIFFCDFPDGGLENTQDVKREVVKIIRKVKPGVLITMDPSELYAASAGIVNHPDHRAAGQAALDAVYPLARDPLIFPELLADGYEPHKVATVLLFRFGLEQSNCGVDIGKYLDRKIAAMASHASQFTDHAELEAWVRGQAVSAGKPYGYEYGESFIRIDVV